MNQIFEGTKTEAMATLLFVVEGIQNDVKRATELAMDLRRDSDTRVLCAVSMMLNVIAPENHG